MSAESKFFQQCKWSPRVATLKACGRDHDVCATAVQVCGAADADVPAPGSASCPRSGEAVPGLPGCSCAVCSAPLYKNSKWQQIFQLIYFFFTMFCISVKQLRGSSGIAPVQGYTHAGQRRTPQFGAAMKMELQRHGCSQEDQSLLVAAFLWPHLSQCCAIPPACCCNPLGTADLQSPHALHQLGSAAGISSFHDDRRMLCRVGGYWCMPQHCQLLLVPSGGGHGLLHSWRSPQERGCRAWSLARASCGGFISWQRELSLCARRNHSQPCRAAQRIYIYS